MGENINLGDVCINMCFADSNPIQDELFTGYILSTMVSLLNLNDVILFLQGLILYDYVYISNLASMLCFNVIDGFC